MGPSSPTPNLAGRLPRSCVSVSSRCGVTSRAETWTCRSGDGCFAVGGDIPGAMTFVIEHVTHNYEQIKFLSERIAAETAESSPRVLFLDFPKAFDILHLEKVRLV